MKEICVVYDVKIKKMVIVLYGKNSNIFTAMMNGEKISKLIKQSYKTKGCRISRIRDKKELFEECKKTEQELEKTSSENVGL